MRVWMHPSAAVRLVTLLVVAIGLMLADLLSLSVFSLGLLVLFTLDRGLPGLRGFQGLLGLPGLWGFQGLPGLPDMPAFQASAEMPIMRVLG